MLIAGLVIASCGSSDGGDAGSTSSAGPLAELLGYGDFDPVESRRQSLEREEAIADCMRQEGFEYQPVDYEAQFDTSGFEENSEILTDPEAYGKKYGYGIVRNYEQYELPYLEGDGDDEGGFGGGQEFEDPNQEYVQSLSPAEQETYYATLYGDFSVSEEAAVEEGSFDEPVEEEYVQPSLEEQGCSGQAELVLGQGNALLSNPDIEQALNDAFVGVEDDTRLTAAVDTWKECLQETLDETTLLDGFVIDGPDSMYQLMDQKKSEASGQRVVPYDETADQTGEIDGEQIYSSSTDGDGNGYAVVGEPKPIAAAALDRLRADELELWAADWDCQNKAKMRDVRQDIEQEVVDDLLAQFPELGNDE